MRHFCRPTESLDVRASQPMTVCMGPEAASHSFYEILAVILEALLLAVEDGQDILTLSLDEVDGWT